MTRTKAGKLSSIAPAAGVLAIVLCSGCATPDAAAPTLDALEQPTEPARAALLAAKHATEVAATASDREALLEVRGQFVDLTASESVAAHAFYFVGYVDSVLASISEVESDWARDVCDHGIAHLKAALELRPDWGEALALLSTVIGQRMQHSGIAAIGYAGQARSAMERAVEVAPDNPRVVLLDGVRLYNFPGLLGGDAGRGTERFAEAIELFQTWRVDDSRAPEWGHADAWVWSGVAAMQAGDESAARAAFTRALELRPGYVWVESTLLPELAAR